MAIKSSIYAASYGKFLFILLLAVFCISQAFAMSDTEKKKIDFLLSKIESSNLTFIRNGKSYTGKDARNHLQNKIDYAGNRLTTADDFINYIASNSSITGRSYYVKTSDGKKMEARQWLEDTLKEMPKDQ
jgi:hypothetical protein